jgi:hypothetical protein
LNINIALTQNEALGEDLRLPRSEFEMDPQMVARMQAQKEARLAQLKAEMGWELERHRVAHQKLRQRFIDPIEGLRFVVKGFLCGHEISSMRVPKASKEYLNHAAGMVFSASRMASWARRAKVTVTQSRRATADTGVVMHVWCAAVLV